jgi:hypothetical protein
MACKRLYRWRVMLQLPFAIARNKLPDQIGTHGGIVPVRVVPRQTHPALTAYLD